MYVDDAIFPCFFGATAAYFVSIDDVYVYNVLFDRSIVLEWRHYSSKHYAR